ncbi:MAG TPA: GGDEF domain-containing protein [Pseudomonadales bacterium]
MSHPQAGLLEKEQRMIHRLVPASLLDNHQTHMKSLVLMLTLLANTVICVLFLPFLLLGFEKTPLIAEDGTILVLICMASYIVSFVLVNRFGLLMMAGNVAQIGIYVVGIIAAWQTGGIFSPMLFLLLIPPVFAFVLTNLLSGSLWSVLTLCTFVGIWGVEELAYAFPDGIGGFMFPASQMVIIDQADFARLCVIIPLLTCIAIIGVVVIYEFNSIRLNSLLSHERNLFAFKASHDPLTGLANREEFGVRAQLAIDSARHADNSVALVYIDLDGFKPINDTLGHHAGDVVLENISDRLQKIVRGSDTVARMGGDEFAIILQGIHNQQQLLPILTKILNTIAQDIVVNQGETVNVHGSLGVALYPQDAETPDQLCRHADMAMYAAKGEKNTWRFYHDLDQQAG